MILIQPFSLGVWLTLIASILASLIMLALYGILHPVKDSSAMKLVYILMAAFLDQSQVGILKTRSNVVRLVLILIVIVQTLTISLPTGFCAVSASLVHSCGIGPTKMK